MRIAIISHIHEHAPLTSPVINELSTILHTGGAKGY